MLWYLSVARWNVDADGRLVARIGGDVAVLAHVCSIGRQEKASLAAVHGRLVRGIGQRDVRAARNEGHIPHGLLAHRNSPCEFLPSTSHRTGRKEDGERIKETYCTHGALCRPPLNFGGSMAKLAFVALPS